MSGKKGRKGWKGDKSAPGQAHIGGAVVYSEKVVAHTDDVIHDAELRSVASQAEAQQRAAVAEAKASAAVAATDY
jgi:hypothetical protein